MVLISPFVWSTIWGSYPLKKPTRVINRNPKVKEKHIGTSLNGDSAVPSSKKRKWFSSIFLDGDWLPYHCNFFATPKEFFLDWLIGMIWFSQNTYMYIHWIWYGYGSNFRELAQWLDWNHDTHICICGCGQDHWLYKTTEFMKEYWICFFMGYNKI